MADTVAILGGGVAGLSAAHELAERGFAVTVYGEWEHQSWWEFVAADRRSAAFGKFLADGLTRTLVAARAREMSARTGGYILLQLLFDLTAPATAPTACSTRRPARPGSTPGPHTSPPLASSCDSATRSSASSASAGGSPP